MELHEYVGNIHVHSRFSDGSGTVPQIIRAARVAGLDFLILADHRTLAGRACQGWYGKMLLLAGEELGLRNGHYLGFGLDRVCEAIDPATMIQEVAGQGGVGFIAHPHDIRLSWPDWAVTGFDGISLWNYTSQWLGAMRRWIDWLVLPFFSSLAVTSPPPETRALWDALNHGPRLVPAIGSSDAHAFGFRPLGIPLVILPYRRLFRAICTHVLLEQLLTGNVTDDERLILAALRKGACYIANHLRGRAHGFRMWVESGENTWGMGETAPSGEELTLRILLPRRGLIVLLRDGCELRSVYAQELHEERLSPGSYRVEVYGDMRRKWGWIFSNPIRVG